MGWCLGMVRHGAQASGGYGVSGMCPLYDEVFFARAVNLVKAFANRGNFGFGSAALDSARLRLALPERLRRIALNVFTMCVRTCARDNFFFVAGFVAGGIIFARMFALDVTGSTWPFPGPLSAPFAA